MAFKDILDWQSIAANTMIKWTVTMFENFKEHLGAGNEDFAKNTNFPWTVAFIVQNTEWLDFNGLSAQISRDQWGNGKISR